MGNWKGRRLGGAATLACVATVAGLMAGAIFGPTRAQPATRSGPADTRCAALVGRQVETGQVEAAERLAAGAIFVGGDTAGAQAPVDLCRVRLRLHPEPGSDIKVEVLLPDTWNHKLFALGGGGFDGALNPGGAALLGKSARDGYATVATDVGHKAGAPLESWVHKQPEKVVDFGHRGNHLAAVVAKQIVAAYYGDRPKHAYFFGCSNGGRDGLSEATHYPEDYDGIIAGSPAQRYLEVLTQMAWNYRAIHGPGGAPQLESKLALINEAVMRQCDALDGLKDGLLENPLVCRFDPKVLQCKGADGPGCLTGAEVAAVRKIYGGTQLRSGAVVNKGPEPGSELTGDGWGGWITPARAADFPQDFYRWLVFDDPSWKFEMFDLDRDYAVARKRVAPIVDPDSGDLRAFARRGGRLIIYQGWNDPGITPGATLGYFDRVGRHLGPSRDDHVRLFMVPGMFHCANGPGATQFDMQPALEAWVEQGKAPERVVAVKPGATPAFSRPLCAWPKTAHYNGSGSTRDAANFTCKAPR
jgi:feruloyl esterase